MRASRIEAVIAQDLAAFAEVRIEVKHVVVEASGDGHIAWQAGADFRMGQEAKEEHNERSAPAEASSLTMGSSLVAIAMRTDPDVGDFHRMLLPGTYDLRISAPGFEAEEIGGVPVTDGAATVVDVILHAAAPRRPLGRSGY